MKSQRIVLVLVAVAVGCSTVNYQSPQFAERASHHQVIAVLPFEMVLTGNPPDNLDPQQMAAIEEAESVAFQEAYYFRLLNQSSVRRKRPIVIEIQPVTDTNQQLAEAGIGVRDSWAMSSKALAKVLRVDAVVRTTVQKTRYLSDGESFGIDLGLQIVNDVTEGRLAAFLPWGRVATSDIWASCELVDSLDGAVLWQDEIARATDWSYPPEQVIAGFTRELARKFPYRG
jgi:hypothetical protein